MKVGDLIDLLEQHPSPVSVVGVDADGRVYGIESVGAATTREAHQLVWINLLATPHSSPGGLLETLLQRVRP